MCGSLLSVMAVLSRQIGGRNEISKLCTQLRALRIALPSRWAALKRTASKREGSPLGLLLCVPGQHDRRLVCSWS
jgi:hypothetical protein